jgi:hypothetical protein
MTIALILALSVCIGVGIRRWWAPLLPVSVGAVCAAAISLSGHGLSDTPIPFIVVTATVAVSVGVLLRTRQLRHSV